MNRNKILSVIFAGSIIAETLISARQFDAVVPQPHIDFEIVVPVVASVSTISVGMFSVIYISSCFTDKNAGKQGQMTEPKRFSSLEDAMRAPFPVGYESAQIWADNGRWVFGQANFGWQPL
jgi:hypothetical protein